MQWGGDLALEIAARTRISAVVGHIGAGRGPDHRRQFVAARKCVGNVYWYRAGRCGFSSGRIV